MSKSPAGALIASIKAQMGDKPLGVVCLDTLNRSLVGSESKDEDMSAYIAAAGKIEESSGALSSSSTIVAWMLRAPGATRR
jgi:hypothetical protein